jgi:predicted CoA-binding protein
VIREAASLGIERICLQQGAESSEGEALCAELGLKLVSGECIFMHG